MRYPDLDVFVEKFAPNVTRGGLFLASRNVHPVGASIAFEIQLVNGDVALAGTGKVTWVKELDPSQPRRPYGMGVQFVNMGAASRAVLARLLRTKSGAMPALRGTGPHATLGLGAGVNSAGGATAATGAAAPAGGAASWANGRPAAPPIDTSVDLASELGVDEAAVRLALDRRRSLGARLDDDLADLLRRDPLEPATIAQALTDLPRLLDPQNSRRRGASGFRVPEIVVSPTSGTPPLGRPVEATPPPSSDLDPAERTNLTEPTPPPDDGGAGRSS